MRNRKHDIERYLRGQLSPAEMHALEKEALTDPFLAEALDGIEQAGADNFLFDLHTLNRSVHHRTRSRTRKGKTVRMWGWTVGIAASVLLIAVSGFLVISLLHDQRQRNLAMKEETPRLKDLPTTRDSVASTLEPQDKEEKADDNLTARKPAAVADTQRTRAVVKEQTAAAEAREDKDLLQDEKTALAENENAPGQLQTRTDVDDVNILESKAAPSIPPEGAVVETDAERKSKRAAGIESSRSAPAAIQRSLSDMKILSGHVRASDDGTSLPGVNVMIKGTNIGTVTDAEGYFYLSLPADQTAIVFSFIGYESKEMPVDDQADVNITLDSDAAQLSEVVVTGVGVDGAPADPIPFRFAEPEGGRSSFKTYLSKSLKYPQQAVQAKTEGKVTVRFTVQPDGKLTDFQVLKGIGQGCEEELIRLIKEGPAWKPSTKEDKAIADQVRVRYKFELPK
jgi:TonB family protein